jgi:hypothetical protein
VTLLPENHPADIRVKLIVSIIQPLAPDDPPSVLTEREMFLDTGFAVTADTDANGFQTMSASIWP